MIVNTRNFFRGSFSIAPDHNFKLHCVVSLVVADVLNQTILSVPSHGPVHKFYKKCEKFCRKELKLAKLNRRITFELNFF